MKKYFTELWKDLTFKPEPKGGILPSQMPVTATKARSCWVGVPNIFNLNQVCRPIVDAWGWSLYHVGSSLERRDYRDVDLRLILDDEEFDKMFPGIGSNHQLDARWSVICAALSEWIGNRSNIPIDFQIQKRSEANAEYGGHRRNPIGIFIAQKEEKKRQKLRVDRPPPLRPSSPGEEVTHTLF